MKKQLYAIITILFGAMAYASAGDIPRKQTPKEIFAKYAKMSQQSNKDANKRILSAQNNKEWEQRESAWKEKRAIVEEQKRIDSLYKKQLQKYAKKASEITKQNSNLELDPKNYQTKLEELTTAKAILADIKAQKKKLMYDYTINNIRAELATLSQTISTLENLELKNQLHNYLLNNPAQKQLKPSIRPLIETIKNECRLLESNKSHRKAFARSSELFHKPTTRKHNQQQFKE
jgi:hypothetical protein